MATIRTAIVRMAIVHMATTPTDHIPMRRHACGGGCGPDTPGFAPASDGADAKVSWLWTMTSSDNPVPPRHQDAGVLNTLNFPAPRSRERDSASNFRQRKLS